MNIFNTLVKIKYDEELIESRKAENAKKNGETYVSKQEVELVGAAMSGDL